MSHPKWKQPLPPEMTVGPPDGKDYSKTGKFPGGLVINYATTHGKGISTDPRAPSVIRDNWGWPIRSGHGYEQILERRKEVHVQLLFRAWEQMLDLMEEFYDNEDVLLEAKINGMATALAILEYGHEYEQDPEETIQRVMREAEAKYDAASVGGVEE